MDMKLLEILVCPSCKGPLVYQQAQQRLICRFDKLAYPIEDDIPVMLVEKAETIELESLEKASA